MQPAYLGLQAQQWKSTLNIVNACRRLPSKSTPALPPWFYEARACCSAACPKAWSSFKRWKPVPVRVSLSKSVRLESGNLVTQGHDITAREKARWNGTGLLQRLELPTETELSCSTEGSCIKSRKFGASTGEGLQSLVSAAAFRL